MKIAIDTNVLLRYLLADDTQQAARARDMLQEAQLVTISLPVLCELVWVLTRGYKLAVTDIADAISTLIDAAKVRVNRAAVENGLAILRAGGDFADGVIAYEGMALGADLFITFDKKAARLLEKQKISVRVL